MLRALKALVQQYVLPLRMAATDVNTAVISEGQLRSIFSDVESIRSLHQQVLLLHNMDCHAPRWL